MSGADSACSAMGSGGITGSGTIGSLGTWAGSVGGAGSAAGCIVASGAGAACSACGIICSTIGAGSCGESDCAWESSGMGNGFIFMFCSDSFFYAKIAANLFCQKFINLVMARNCRYSFSYRIEKYTVFPAFANENTARFQKVFYQ